MTDSSSSAIVLFLIELRCLQCGRVAGTLETRHWPSYAPSVLRVDGARQQISDWTRLRCARCAGNLYADEVGTTRVSPRVSWDDLDPPRRGRPPRWLAAQRQGPGDVDDE